MAVWQDELEITTPGKGLLNITEKVVGQLSPLIRDLQEPGNALVNLFIMHTSASLLVQENADPTARQDLEEFLDRLVPENQGWHRHLDEGPDDTVSHMKAALTATSLTLPVSGGRLALGRWQGIYIWEHRRASHRRRIRISVLT